MSKEKIYDVYKVMQMKTQTKKTEFISFRTDVNTKAALEQAAADRKWSISLLTEEIVKEWIHRQSSEAQQPQEI